MSLSSLDDPSALLRNVLGTIPAGQNPFPYFERAMEYALRPGTASNYRAQLYALSALLALESVLLFISVMIRWRRGTFWLFRIHRPSNVILPHYINTWTLSMSLALALTQGYIWVSVFFNDGRGNDKDYAGWITLVWIPHFLAFWLACWSLCVSHALHLDASGKKPVMSSAWPLNSFGLGVAAAFTICIGATGGLCDKHWREAMDTYRVLARFFQQSAVEWQGGAITPTQQSQAIALVSNFVWHYKRFVENFRRVWIVFFVFTAVLEITFITVATLHLRALKKTLSEISDQTSRKQSVPTLQEIAVRKTYRALVWVTIILGIILTIFECLFLFVTIEAASVASQSREKEAASLLGLYLFLPGLPLSAFLVYRSFETPPSAQPAADAQVTQLELSPSKHEHSAQDSFGSSTTHNAARMPSPVGVSAKAYEARAMEGTPSVLSYRHDEGSASIIPSSSPSPGPYASAYPARTASSPFEYNKR